MRLNKFLIPMLIQGLLTTVVLAQTPPPAGDDAPPAPPVAGKEHPLKPRHHAGPKDGEMVSIKGAGVDMECSCHKAPPPPPPGVDAAPKPPAP